MRRATAFAVGFFVGLTIGHASHMPMSRMPRQLLTGQSTVASYGPASNPQIDQSKGASEFNLWCGPVEDIF